MDINSEQRATVFCKCGKRADFIKDYWVAEACVKKEKTYDHTYVADLENTCGILRRRYCGGCLGKIAAQKRRVNGKLDAVLLISVFIPMLMASGKAFYDWFTALERGAPTLWISFALFTVLVMSALSAWAIRGRLQLSKIVKGDYSDLKSVDKLLDSLNEALSEWQAVKDVPSVDIAVDGDGRVNYGMERSGFNMKVMLEGSVAIEGVRSRFRYPIKDEFEHIRRAYINAGLLEDNLRTGDETASAEKDFDIRGGELKRYSGCACEIRIPDGVTAIAVSAFKNSKNCERVFIPETVTAIGAEAFSGCPAESINIPSAVAKIEKFAFYRSGLTEAVIPEGVTEIENNAFDECYNLRKVSIPSTCKRVGEYAFRGCVNLTELEIAEGVEAISDYAFNGCSALRRAVIPEGVCEIGNFAFEKCIALESLYLPDSIQFMGGRAFDGNIGMTIYGKAGSYAERYAEETRRRFSEIKEKSEIPKMPHKGAKRQ